MSKDHKDQELFRSRGYRVMALIGELGDMAKAYGIDKGIVLMRDGMTYMAYRYAKSGLYSDPFLVQ